MSGKPIGRRRMTAAERMRRYRHRKTRRVTLAKADAYTLCRLLIEANHYLHSWPSGPAHVYVYESAIVVFSLPPNPYLAKSFGLRNGRVWLARMWAPDGHRANLLTEAISFAVREFHKLELADLLIAYADPAVGHEGHVYRAASWTALGTSRETRGNRHKPGNGDSGGKLRFAHGLTRAGKVSIQATAATPVQRKANEGVAKPIGPYALLDMARAKGTNRGAKESTRHCSMWSGI